MTAFASFDGKLIAEDWTDHAPASVTGEVSLQAGKSCDLSLNVKEKSAR
jgi:hypothetical protein